MVRVSLVDLSWVFKLVFRVFGFLFVFSTDSTDTVIDQSAPNGSDCTCFLRVRLSSSPRSMAAFIGVSDILVKVSSRMPGLDYWSAHV